MGLRRYRRVLRVRAVRQVLVLGVIVRTPIFAGGVVLTLHVVSHLGLSYGAAGLATAVLTVAIAVSGPWRGRLLDRFGLRRTIVPSIVIAAGCWSVAPFSGYWVLVVLAALYGLFVIPVFSVVRQALIVAVREDDRRTVISLDSSVQELSFMIGPVVAVWAATTWPTPWVLFTVHMSGVLAGILLWLVNPALRRAPGADAPVAAATATAAQAAGPAAVAHPVSGTPPDGGHGAIRRSDWFGSALTAVLLTALATTIILAGTDIAIVATLREAEQAAAIGWVLAVWGLGSLVGGLVYGGLYRSIPAFWLLGALGAVTAPMALATGAPSLAAWGFLAGLLCAPSITATVDQVSRVVPERVLGEAMAWHGSSMTMGLALGAPLAGAAIDRAGPAAGFVLVGAVGLVVAVLGGVVPRLRRGRGGSLPRRDAPATA